MLSFLLHRWLVFVFVGIFRIRLLPVLPIFFRHGLKFRDHLKLKNRVVSKSSLPYTWVFAGEPAIRQTKGIGQQSGSGLLVRLRQDSFLQS